jgi:hypothetical protein
VRSDIDNWRARSCALYAPAARVTYRAFGFEQEGIGLGQVARRRYAA